MLTVAFTCTHSRLSPAGPNHSLLLTTLPLTVPGHVEVALRSFTPVAMGHSVFVHRASVLGLKGIPFRETDVTTLPSATGAPGLLNTTVIFRG